LTTTITTQDKENRKEIIRLLSKKEAEGFKHGEVSKFIENLANRYDVSVSTVQNIYYNKVKGQAQAQLTVEYTSTSNVITSKAQANNELERVLTINGVEVRIVKDKDKPVEEYFVAKNVFNSINVERTSEIAKKGVTKDQKHYVKVKTMHGYAKTLVLKQDAVEKLMNYIIKVHPSSETKTRARNFLDALTNSDTTVTSNVESPTSATNNNITETTKTTNNDIKSSASTDEEADTKNISSNDNLNRTTNEDNSKQNIVTTPVAENKSSNLKTEEVKQPQIEPITEEVEEVAKVEDKQTTSEPVHPTVTKTYEEPLYRYGQLVTAEVKAVKNYGFLVQTMDEHMVQGLVHISDIKDAFIHDVYELAEVGDIIEAKVKKYDKFENRLNLSTKELPKFRVGKVRFEDEFSTLAEKEAYQEQKYDNGATNSNITDNSSEDEIIASYAPTEKPINNPMAEKLLSLKDKLNLTPTETPTVEPKQEEPIHTPVQQTISNSSNEEEVTEDKASTEKTSYSYVIGENKKVNKEIKTLNRGDENMITTDQVRMDPNPLSQLEIERNREINNILDRLKDKVGAISPQAREKLVQLLSEKGLVEFTIAMMQVIPDFKPDLGLILLNQIEEKVNDGL